MKLFTQKVELHLEQKSDMSGESIDRIAGA